MDKRLIFEKISMISIPYLCPGFSVMHFIHKNNLNIDKIYILFEAILCDIIALQ